MTQSTVNDTINGKWHNINRKWHKLTLNDTISTLNDTQKLEINAKWHNAVSYKKYVYDGCLYIFNLRVEGAKIFRLVSMIFDSITVGDWIFISAKKFWWCIKVWMTSIKIREFKKLTSLFHNGSMPTMFAKYSHNDLNFSHNVRNEIKDNRD